MPKSRTVVHVHFSSKKCTRTVVKRRPYWPENKQSDTARAGKKKSVPQNEWPSP